MASDTKACFLSKVKYRAVIGYLFLNGQQARKYIVN